MLTHALSLLLDIPTAHSPMMTSKEVMELDVGVVDPRKSAELERGRCFPQGLFRWWSPDPLLDRPPLFTASHGLNEAKYQFGNILNILFTDYPGISEITKARHDKLSQNGVCKIFLITFKHGWIKSIANITHPGSDSCQVMGDIFSIFQSGMNIFHQHQIQGCCQVTIVIKELY